MLWTFTGCFTLGLFVQLLCPAHAQELHCCSHATGSCKNVCEKISLVNIAANSSLLNSTQREVKKFCSAQLDSFWECLNGTFDDMTRGESWTGRLCCPLPHSDTCRRACVTAVSPVELLDGCRHSDEIAFYNCLEWQRYGDECCAYATGAECATACNDIFRSRLTPTLQERSRVMRICAKEGGGVGSGGGESSAVTQCLRNVTRVTPVKDVQKHMRCCDRSNKSKCREACKSVLATTTTLQEIIDGLQFGGCGPPLFQDQFWQCFLKPEPIPVTVEVSRIDRVGMDSAKWHCCQRASTNACRKLCSKTFTRDWSTLWEEFHVKCLNHVAEEQLRNCIDEVDEPCELGCDGLSFCSNFNNRPTELFRSCRVESDEAARNDVTLWQSQRELTLPGVTLPLRNSTKCSGQLWKAVACTLQIKPCSRHSHGTQICRDVCLEILSQCVDWSRVPDAVEHSVETICATLSSDNPHESCITLDRYLNPPETNYPRLNGEVSSPCKSDPCERNEICTVNRNCPAGVPSHVCKPYKCERSCKLGEVSEYSVPDRTFVRIPIPNNPKGCLKICQCARGKIEQCHLLPCLTLSGCWLGNNVFKEHLSTFDVECNKCTCYAGEVICSRRQCLDAGAVSRRFTSLPCNCPARYSPVCGRNGIMYASACLAQCSGLGDADIDYNGCTDPCKSNPCPVGQKCIPDSKVCLSLLHKPCNQYQCINGSTHCRNLPKYPVCDINNREHENACFLAHSNERLGYYGPCRKNCKSVGRVCGYNGRSYQSECAAHADFVSVDYQGSCKEVGVIYDVKRQQCEDIKCEPLPEKDCLGITPPGACCPICAGALKLLYSRKQISRALYVLQDLSTAPLTLHAVLAALDRQIQVAQCTLRGFITPESDIFVSVEVISPAAAMAALSSTSSEVGTLVKSNAMDAEASAALQREACVREAEKIATLVNRQSPRVASELPLSSLIAAFAVHTLEVDVAGAAGSSTCGVVTVLPVVVSVYWAFVALGR